MLFHRPSGTGKTIAAQVLAGESQLDLHHLDVSPVISKYIGETEANVRCLRRAAEAECAKLDRRPAMAENEAWA